MSVQYYVHEFTTYFPTGHFVHFLFFFFKYIIVWTGVFLHAAF